MTQPALSPSPPQSCSELPSQRPSASFAFLVHSQSAFSQNQPPNVDNKPLARQKRRRTSPEDQALLEREYLRNPKPDKAARMDIVSRVALGEKEVQIWFQNRRQTARRKSRPLSPHELFTSSQSSRTMPSLIENLDNSNSSTQTSSQPLIIEDLPSSQQGSSQPEHISIEEPQASPHLSQTSDCERGTSYTSGDSAAPSKCPDVYQSSSSPPEELVSSSHAALTRTSSIQATSSSCQKAPNLKSSMLRRVADVQKPEAQVLGLVPPAESWCHVFNSKEPILVKARSSEVAVTSRSLRRTSSNMRISMSLEGKAQVITDEDNSPPRRHATIPQVGQNGLHQPLTTYEGVTLGRAADQSEGRTYGRMLRRTLSGRSRDSRTWEFYCDSEARNALSAKADLEQSGSAVGAIGLLRARNTNSLHSAGNRGSPSSTVDGSKRPRRSANRVKSGISRKSSFPQRDRDETGSKRGTVISPRDQRLFRSPSGESDKENWVPGTQKPPSCRDEGLLEETSSEPLRENMRIPSLSASFGVHMKTAGRDFRATSSPSPVDLPGRSHSVKSEKASGGFAILPDVELSREEADLDCVQNLLSLSQGNWR
ncbi:MAG: hypothetical protein M1833_001165 [Piccolia ochrophora]|nr:MAG: hypothetical protein M1833_001165 [Piccolia ochrophora]